MCVYASIYIYVDMNINSMHIYMCIYIHICTYESMYVHIHPHLVYSSTRHLSGLQYGFGDGSLNSTLAYHLTISSVREFLPGRAV